MFTDCPSRNYSVFLSLISLILLFHLLNNSNSPTLECTSLVKIGLWHQKVPTEAKVILGTLLNPTVPPHWLLPGMLTLHIHRAEPTNPNPHQ